MSLRYLLSIHLLWHLSVCIYLFLYLLHLRICCVDDIEKHQQRRFSISSLFYFCSLRIHASLLLPLSFSVSHLYINIFSFSRYHFHAAAKSWHSNWAKFQCSNKAALVTWQQCKDTHVALTHTSYVIVCLCNRVHAAMIFWRIKIKLIWLCSSMCMCVCKLCIRSASLEIGNKIAYISNKTDGERSLHF